jgi:hypothetical protein
VVDAYNLVFAAMILAAGPISDRVGRKGLPARRSRRLYRWHPGCLSRLDASTSRAVMGVGAAAVFPATLPMIANGSTTPEPELEGA